MKPSLYLLIPALFLVSCDQQEVATTTLAAQQAEPDNYDDCITDSMLGVSSDVAARAIIESCQNQFPTESEEVVEAPAPVVVDASRLVARNDTFYEINSDTPFTGVSLTYHENGQVNDRVTFKDGKQNGLFEGYYENGQLAVTVNLKNDKDDGLLESYREDGTLDFRMNYKDGELDGLWESYREVGTLFYRENYKDGEVDGIREFYREDGTLSIIENYTNGERDGLREEYREDGTLDFRMNYKDGEFLGSCDEPGCTDF
jgi:antitoxin component YwqK of YwqJK toxin-antitoxin module